MSDASTNAPRPNVAQKALPAWMTAGVMGLALGGGACYLAMYYHYAPDPETTYKGLGANGPIDGSAASAAGGMPGGMGGGMGGGGMGGGGMGGGGMGGGGMGGGGGGGGGGGARGKRNLTSIVGKLDLASKGITFRLDDEQSAKLAAKLAELEEPKMMSQEAGQELADAIESLLTDEQKETLALFEMPRPAPAANAGNAPDMTNPFHQEDNQSRLHSLLGRVKGAAPDAGAAQQATAEEEGAAKEATEVKADEAKTEVQEAGSP